MGTSMFIRVCFTVLAICAGAAQAAPLPVEVVQTVPIETNLALPGIRETQQVWVEMINSARQSIDLEQFYITSQPGQALDPVLSAVRTAAARGVQVRFIVDSNFYKTYPNDPNALAAVPNIKVKVINFTPGIQHSKFFVVDGVQSFVGSANFDWLALSHIHEVGLHFADSQLSAGLEQIFARDWNVAALIGPNAGATDLYTPPFRAGTRLPGFQLFASPPSALVPGVTDTLTALLHLISSAKRSISVQVYQYSARMFSGAGRWTVLDNALRAAAARGVHVQLMVDHVAMKSGGPDLTALNSVPNVEVRLVTIPQWSGGPLDYARLIHSKYMIVDEASAWVGTENWQDSYFTNSRNVGLIVQEPQTVSQLMRIYHQVWTSPYISSP